MGTYSELTHAAVDGRVERVDHELDFLWVQLVLQITGPRTNARIDVQKYAPTQKTRRDTQTSHIHAHCVISPQLERERNGHTTFWVQFRTEYIEYQRVKRTLSGVPRIKALSS